VLDQHRRKWNWSGHTLRRSDDSIAKQVLQWMPQSHRGRGRPRNTWKRDLERELLTAGFRFSWRKIETATQDRAGCRRVVCGLCSTGRDMAPASQCHTVTDPSPQANRSALCSSSQKSVIHLSTVWKIEIFHVMESVNGSRLQSLTVSELDR